MYCYRKQQKKVSENLERIVDFHIFATDLSKLTIMKKALLILLILLSALQVAAAPVDAGKAMSNAESFLKKHYTKSTANRRAPALQATLTQSEHNDENYYVFNVAGGGFVIAAADDAVTSILGYSEQGTFSSQEIPVGMQAWLDDCNAQIQAVKDGESAAADLGDMPERTPVLPLLKSTWGQGVRDGSTGYNMKCPKMGTYYCLTGCVATAMAQIMRYHEWPEMTGEIPGYTQPYVSGYPRVPAQDALSPVSFDWNHMLDNYTGGETREQLEAVAELMHYCGQSVETRYGYDASGAVVEDIVCAMRDFFGYDEDIRYILRSDYNLRQWLDIIYGEIADGRPVLLGGQDTRYGHAFVCDGYLSEGFFHINWGWDGDYDGYYLLSLCNPSNSAAPTVSGVNYGYSRAQEAVVGIQRPDGAASPLQLTVGAVSVDSLLSARFTNNTGLSHVFEYGVARLSDSGFEVLAQAGADFPANADTVFAYNLAEAALPDGSYEVCFVSRLEGSDRWIDSYSTFVRVTVADGEVVADVPASHLVFHEGHVSTDGYVGERQELLVTVTNDGDRDYHGQLYLLASRYSKPSSYTTCNEVTVPSHGSAQIPFYFSPSAAGTFTIWVSAMPTGKEILGSFKAVISDAFNPRNYKVGELALVDSEKSENGTYTVFSPDFIVNIPVANNDTVYALERTFELGLYRQTYPGSSHYTMQWAEKFPVSVPVGETAVCSYNLEGVEANDSLLYMVKVSHNLEASGSCAQLKFSNMKGITVYSSDGMAKKVGIDRHFAVAEDVVAVDLRGVSQVESVSLNGNPNTLYLLDDDARLPEGLEDANIVRGAVAENITLYDGFCFYTPIRFKAAAITYTRAPKRCYNAEKTIVGWESMVLPFAAQKVVRVSDGRELSWFFSASDDRGDMWIMECLDVDGDVVFCDYPDSLKANTPYLITVPDDWTEQDSNMQCSEIAFCAVDAIVESTAAGDCGDCVFSSTLSCGDQSPVYVLDDEGRQFKIADDDIVIEPFRLYFRKSIEASMPVYLSLDLDELNPMPHAPMTTDIAVTGKKMFADEVTYNLAGMRTTRSKGFYIIGGKKYVSF